MESLFRSRGRGRRGKQDTASWYYSVHFWHQEGIDWPDLIEAAERPRPDLGISTKAPGRQWFAGLRSGAASCVPRATAIFGVFLALWLARQFYLGGRIPFLREPEKFRIESTPPDNSWPAPLEAGEGPRR
jgi:hypothetical protein